MSAIDLLVRQAVIGVVLALATGAIWQYGIAGPSERAIKDYQEGYNKAKVRSWTRILHDCS